MSLPPGAQLGPYEILAELGSGGMGMVYRALDTRLNREVAIKVILQAPGPSARHHIERLEREARAIARINHPNILQVFDVGEHGGAPFVVMELLPGETLRQHLEGGPRPAPEVVGWFIQIAQGLAAAHGKGLIHRDLKPENVLITPDGRVKILDFGLAKPMPGATGTDATSGLPAQGADLTAEGAMLGTVGYLSPEQIRGTAMDGRSDLFSLGAMLFEAVVGDKPFRRATTVESMTAILREEVVFPDSGSVAVPPTLEQVIRTCLAKDPADRFQTAGDLMLALQDLDLQSGGTRPRGAPALAGAPAGAGPRPWLNRGLVLKGAGAAALVLVGALGYRAAGAGPSAPLRAEWVPVTARPGLTATARFTPDGESVVYSAALGPEPPTLHTIRIGQVIPTNLGMVGQVMAVGGDGPILFVQSPKRIHPGAAALGMLSEFMADGTQARPLLDQTESADRSTDGRILAVVRVEVGATGRLNHLECPPGRSLHRTSGWLYCPRLSPDGARLAILESQGPDSWNARIRVLDLQGATLFLSEVLSIQSLAWAPDSREILYTRSPGVIEAMDLRGRVRPLLQGPHLLHLYDVATDGRLLVTSYQDHSEVFITSPGQAVRTAALSAWAARLDADGGRFLFTGPGPKGGDMTYLQPSDGEVLRPVAPGKLLALAGDGSAVLLKRQRALYRVPTGPGTEAAVPLGNLGTVWRAAFMPGREAVQPPSASAQRIAVIAAAPGKDFQLHVVDPVGGPQLTLDGSEGIRQVVPVGPDELVGDALDGGLRRFSLDGRPWAPLSGARTGDVPLGRKAGSDLLFVQEAYERPGVLSICTIDLRRGRRALWRTLTFPILPGLRSAQVLSIAPDGSRIAFFTWTQPNDLFTVAGLVTGRMGR